MMNKVEDETNLNSICKKFGKQFIKDENDEKLYCPSCGVELAEQYISEESKIPKSGWIKKHRIWASIRPIIILASISVIAIRAPKVISVMKEQKPIRNGTYETDSKTNQCIKNLWKISRLLQEGKLPEKDLVCPVSQKPYVLRTIEGDGDIVVTCPNPELHGFKEIRVTKTYPCPEVIK